jgi:hypothetical protein
LGALMVGSYLTGAVTDVREVMGGVSDFAVEGVRF